MLLKRLRIVGVLVGQLPICSAPGGDGAAGGFGLAGGEDDVIAAWCVLGDFLGVDSGETFGPDAGDIGEGH